MPDLVWAALVEGPDGVRVHDHDGRVHPFDTAEEAVAWLREDEYEALEDLREAGEVPPGLVPPACLPGRGGGA